MITVANIRTTKEGLYIGRTMPRLPGSVLGNPFRLEREADREQVCGRYEMWLEAKLTWDSPQRAEIYRLRDIHQRGETIVLLCWCAPKLCHGDIIKRIVERP
jgi:hypothetical protein